MADRSVVRAALRASAPFLSPAELTSWASWASFQDLAIIAALPGLPDAEVSRLLNFPPSSAVRTAAARRPDLPAGARRGRLLLETSRRVVEALIVGAVPGEFEEGFLSSLASSSSHTFAAGYLTAQRFAKFELPAADHARLFNLVLSKATEGYLDDLVVNLKAAPSEVREKVDVSLVLSRMSGYDGLYDLLKGCPSWSALWSAVFDASHTSWEQATFVGAFRRIAGPLPFTLSPAQRLACESWKVPEDFSPDLARMKGAPWDSPLTPAALSKMSVARMAEVFPMLREAMFYKYAPSVEPSSLWAALASNRRLKNWLAGPGFQLAFETRTTTYYGEAMAALLADDLPALESLLCSLELRVLDPRLRVSFRAEEELYTSLLFAGADPAISLPLGGVPAVSPGAVDFSALQASLLRLHGTPGFRFDLGLLLTHPAVAADPSVLDISVLRLLNWPSCPSTAILASAALDLSERLSHGAADSFLSPLLGTQSGSVASFVASAREAAVNPPSRKAPKNAKSPEPQVPARVSGGRTL